jgi:hypothetical protein
MKALKLVLIACSLSAAVAHAQTAAPAAEGQQVAQTTEQHANGALQQGRKTAPAKKAAECVGPVSYCTLFFGS